jgi:hypothetical protein
MTSGLRSFGLTVGMAALLAGAAACSDNKTGAEHFVGTWTYAGMINPLCAGTAETPLDLTGYSVVVTEIDQAHISVQLGTMCTVKFDVDGFKANAQPNQSCMFVIGSYGSQTVMIKTWTLTSTGTDTITSDFSGTAFICTADGTGSLARQAGGDAGAVD